MKVTIQSTDRIVSVEVNGRTVPARVWQGKTESGIEVSMLVTRVVAPVAEDLTQFEAELTEHEPPSAMSIQAIPMRFIL